MQTAYCPWCGAEREPISVSPAHNDIEWAPCKTPRCKGGFITLVTSEDGYVIHPYHLRGRYVFARNNMLNKEEKK